MKLLNVKWSAKRTIIALAAAAGLWVLYEQGSAQRAAQDDTAEPTSGTTQCRVQSTVDSLNVRSAPVLDPNNVVDQLDQGEQVDADPVVENGFRKLDEGRWVWVEYLRTVEGTDCG